MRRIVLSLVHKLANSSSGFQAAQRLFGLITRSVRLKKDGSNSDISIAKGIVFQDVVVGRRDSLEELFAEGFVDSIVCFELPQIVIVLVVGNSDLGAGSVGAMDGLRARMIWHVERFTSTSKVGTAGMHTARYPLAPRPRVEWRDRALAQSSRVSSFLMAADVGLPAMGVSVGYGKVNAWDVVGDVMVVAVATDGCRKQEDRL
jgi:hypothetical protein